MARQITITYDEIESVARGNPQDPDICRLCGAVNPRGSRFCNRCGRRVGQCKLAYAYFAGPPSPCGIRPIVFALAGDSQVFRIFDNGTGIHVQLRRDILQRVTVWVNV